MLESEGPPWLKVLLMLMISTETGYHLEFPTLIASLPGAGQVRLESFWKIPR